MTKHPIVFINGPRSLFFYEKLGGNLQDYLAAHGYLVNNPPLPFRGHQRLNHLMTWLTKQNSKKFHFILGKKTQIEFKEILENFPDSTFTFTDDFQDSFSENEIRPNIAYQLHSLFCRAFGTEPESFSATLPSKNVVLFDRFLDRCIELAENE